MILKESQLQGWYAWQNGSSRECTVGPSAFCRGFCYGPNSQFCVRAAQLLLNNATENVRFPSQILETISIALDVTFL
jgi:hypothetical protein